MRKLIALPAIGILVLLVAGCGPAAPPDIHADAFLVCTRAHESDVGDVNGNGLHDGGYGAINWSGPYFGAYQFLQSTWNSSASHAGFDALVGVRPDQASVEEQDAVAWSLYQWQGKSPWGGRC